MPGAQPISVVIPAYNAAETLPALAARLGRVLDESDEVVIVEDGGRDQTWTIVEGLVLERPGWSGIQLGRNSGQHAALLAGIRAAKHSVIVTMDDDLQHRPEDVPSLLAALTPDLDLVYGVSISEEHSATRSLGSRVVKRVLRASLGVDHAESISAFRCFRAHLRSAFEDVNDPYVSVDVLLSWGTGRVAATPVEMQPRSAGVSGYTLRALVRHTANMVTGYSAAPLRVVAYLGAMIGAVGLGTLAYVLGRWLMGDTTVPGFTLLASLLALVGGIQMIAIAVIGEYLARVHFRTMKRPSYFIRRRAPARRG